MDPTRPFRNPLAAPRRPAAVVEPQPEPPRHAEPLPPPPTQPLPQPEPPPRRGHAYAAKRFGESFLLAISVLWLGIAIIGLTTGRDAGAYLVGLATGIPLLYLAAWVRKRRLGNPTLWTIEPYRHNLPEANTFEKVAAVVLLIFGGLIFAVVLGNSISAGLGAQDWAGFLIAGICIVPGMIMWLRRKGTP